MALLSIEEGLSDLIPYVEGGLLGEEGSSEEEGFLKRLQLLSAQLRVEKSNKRTANGCLDIGVVVLKMGKGTDGLFLERSFVRLFTRLPPDRWQK